MRFRQALVTLPILIAAVHSAPAMAKQPATPPRAQQQKAPPQTPPPASPPPPTPAAPEIVITDAMLSPVPPPPHVLKDWPEALSYINSRDTDLKTALLEIERQKGVRRTALAAALPQIDATGSLTVQLLRQDVTETNPLTGASITETTPPSPVENASISITQPILAPRAWYAIGTADANIDLSKISVEDARRKLITNVASAIVDVVNAEQLAEINRSNLRDALQRLALQKRKVDLGGGANLDVVRFQQDANVARQTLVQGDENLLEARERLGIALGANEAYGVPHDIKLDDIEASATKTCKAGELKDRADIRALYKKKEIAARAITDADLEYLPTAEVSSTLTASSEQIVGTGHASWNVMGVLSIPIWDGGAKYGRRRSAKAETDEAQLSIDSAMREGTIEVTQAQRGIDLAQRNKALAEEARDLAKENERLEQLAFDGGAGTSFDLVDASNKRRQAEVNLALSELALTRASITALLATASCDY